MIELDRPNLDPVTSWGIRKDETLPGDDTEVFDKRKPRLRRRPGLGSSAAPLLLSSWFESDLDVDFVLLRFFAGDDESLRFGVEISSAHTDLASEARIRGGKGNEEDDNELSVEFFSVRLGEIGVWISVGRLVSSMVSDIV